MTEYVISYDICAFMLMSVFAAYYFMSKRFESVSNTMFNVLIWLVIGSIVFDLIGVTTITFKDFFPLWANYAANIIYFLITGLMSTIFCLYTLSQTRSYVGGKTFGFYLFFFLPYDIFAVLLLSTPFTKLIFYFDEDRIYRHGPLMNILLIVVIAYLAFSMFRVTFFHDNISIRKRMPYYTFTILMVASIIIQAVFGIYLMYGIAEALGIVVLFITNHNPNDLIDTTSGLFNRKAFFAKIEQMTSDNMEFSLVGFGIDSGSGADADAFTSEFRLFLHEQLGVRLNNMFDEKNVFYIDDSCYAIIVESKSKNTAYTETRIKSMFSTPWKHFNENIVIRIGVGRMDIPDDATQSSQIYELLHAAVRMSKRLRGKTVEASAVRDEREQKLIALENEQKILEEKYHEADLQKQQAIEADRSKSMFLAQMSHEIRTPMTAILGMTELLLRDSSDPAIIEHANAIMNSGKSLLGIINDILDFSKIEAGKLEILEDKYYIHSVIYDIINSVEQKVSDKRLRLKVYFDPNIPAAMFGDEIRVKQIIINFLTNAIKYTEVGTVTLKLYQEDNDGEKVNLCCSVEDTGIGIREENIPKLFDGFERFDSQRNKAIEGTGLGLAICKMIIEHIGGSIEVKSEYGVGSTFTAKIPQKIVDPTPTIAIDNPEDYNFLVLCDEYLYKDEVDTCLEDFNIAVKYVENFDEFDTLYYGASCSQYSHIVISYDAYEALDSANSDILKDSRIVIALNYRQYMADLRGRQVAHLPICSINLLQLVNGIPVTESDKPKLEYLDYIAPDVKLLAVDDNLVNLKIFTGLLECHKMKIDCADSGDKAIRMSREKKYDMIFLDHMMPKKDGIETLHEMMQDESNLNKETPVIAFTANAISGMKEMFIEQGFTDFLSKPINIPKMEAMLREFLPADKLVPADVQSESSDRTATVSGIDNENGAFTIPGLNMGNALEYTAGSYDTLKMVLETFVSDGMTKVELLPKYIENADYANYQIEIHAVKSLCKGIGADELSEKARLLEFACKDNDIAYVTENCDEAYREYRALLETVDAELKKLNSPGEEKADKSEGATLKLDYREQLTCMLALLHEYEEELSSKLADDLIVHKSELPAAVAEALEQIKNCLGLYDYDGAAEKITEVLNEN